MNLREMFVRKFDWLLFLPAVILSCLGLVAIYSTDLADAGDFGNFKKQLLAFFLGLLILFLAAFLDFRQLRNAKNLLYFFAAGILLAVLLFGKTIRGTRGWFSVGSLTFQPVELVKIILALFLAEYFSREGRRIYSLGHIVKSFVAAAILIVLVMGQPDLGSSIILFCLWLGMLLISRMPKRYFYGFLTIFICLTAAIGYFVFVQNDANCWKRAGSDRCLIYPLKQYQKDRVRVFINPELDPLGAGYNIKQSVIAIGSGGFWGKGLGFGSQSQLRFLPESRTDFIFALVAEEMGFVMVATVLFLYAVFFYFIFRIMRESHDDFTIYLSMGFLIVFFAEVMINIGMNLGLAPVTGLALPFVSLGGSSLISKLLMVGILESVKMRS
jgi:rod shape determining protein RodA